MSTPEMDEFRRIKRLPPYVFAIVNELKAEARSRGEDIIDFGMGNPDQPTPEHIVDKLVEAAQRKAWFEFWLEPGTHEVQAALLHHGAGLTVQADGLVEELRAGCAQTESTAPITWLNLVAGKYFPHATFEAETFMTQDDLALGTVVDNEAEALALLKEALIPSP